MCVGLVHVAEAGRCHYVLICNYVACFHNLTISSHHHVLDNLNKDKAHKEILQMIQEEDTFGICLSWIEKYAYCQGLVVSRRVVIGNKIPYGGYMQMENPYSCRCVATYSYLPIE
ncbi:hypothetical protein GOP47_0006495 [Adiantum capillus-veneris]|uniref:Uncharacterized protein n=1 Tax=Adiantum capillus-veneris TaxID=13818 RepID=A0A9D4V2Z5_ADICA|nr:hypothetical protein GOP47_0006495 [Adiantum capillus-veneris]